MTIAKNFLTQFQRFAQVRLRFFEFANQSIGHANVVTCDGFRLRPTLECIADSFRGLLDRLLVMRTRKEAPVTSGGARVVAATERELCGAEAQARTG